LPTWRGEEVVGSYSLIKATTRAAAVARARRLVELRGVRWPAFAGEAEIRPVEDVGGAPRA
jgi:hypothetical protein